MEVEEVVTSFCVVNEPAERSVTAAGNRISTISTEKAFQATPYNEKVLPPLNCRARRHHFQNFQPGTLR